MTSFAASLAVVGLATGITTTHAADRDGRNSYVADPALSRLEFVGFQAGAEFKGFFRRFTTMIELSPDLPENGQRSRSP